MMSFGFLHVRELLDLRVVDLLGLRVEAVGHGVEVAAAHVDARAVREVAAVLERHAEDGVARMQRRVEHGWLACAPECGCTLA